MAAHCYQPCFRLKTNGWWQSLPRAELRLQGQLITRSTRACQEDADYSLLG